jgi:hypothetical protein
MSTTDTMTPLVPAPWFDADGNPLPVRALPGLRPEVVRGLECSYPGIIHPTLRALLETCWGLAATELGSVDFTGCWFPEEPCPVFRPCLTLAIDDAGRRWIAEIGDKDLPGPIWCVFPDPKVAVYVSDDLAAFIGTLRGCACRGETLKWLQNLSAQARTVWTRRHALARRPNELHESDEQIRGWLAGLPFDAMCMTYALQRSCAAGRTGSWGHPADFIAVDDCRSLRSPGHPRKAGAKSSVRRFLPGRSHPLIAPIAALWTYGHAHERDAKKAPWRRDLVVGVRGCGAVRCDA